MAYKITITMGNGDTWSYDNHSAPITSISEDVVLTDTDDGVTVFNKRYIRTVESVKEVPQRPPDPPPIVILREDGQDMTKPWWKRW